MKKRIKMYEAPKAEVVELNTNKGFMDWHAGSAELSSELELQ